MSVFAAATGVGSWPGCAPRSAAEVVVGELDRLPYLPELPARGVGADLIGRAGALLVDIAVDTVPRGYRVAGRPGSVVRRAASLLAEDLDALEEAWAAAGAGDRPVKVAVPGPVTLAAELELGSGHRAITDAGALRDLAGSLAEGVARHRAEVARRLATTVVVQFDEPLRPAALAGRLAGVTALTPVHPVDEARAVELLDECAAAAGGAAMLHCCAAELPWKVIQRSAFDAVCVDVMLLGDAGLDGLGEFLDSGRSAVLGLLNPEPRHPVSPAEVASAAAAVVDRLGFARTALAERVGISPPCGLAGVSADQARAITVLSRRAADILAADPDAVPAGSWPSAGDGGLG